MEDSFRQLEIVRGDSVVAGYARSPDSFRLKAAVQPTFVERLLRLRADGGDFTGPAQVEAGPPFGRGMTGHGSLVRTGNGGDHRKA